ncbi:protein phosphatase 1 regulatory subunit 14B isoform X1 [Pan troglodytes]|uniref:protein phosphatase 1 regulatory subunit 14B isoform X1 n=1 Tax=Pan troglodytes TaxID=9598 RepID=UPI002436AE00|nr:protein phosphatase 1 regulatory subunit 14B isoform X2 [Pan paniscus]
MADSGTAGGAALAAPAPGPGSGGPGPRVYFQSPPGAAGEGPGGADDEGPVRRQGKVTVKYDRKELRKRLNLEEWILEQLTRLYDCQSSCCSVCWAEGRVPPRKRRSQNWRLTWMSSWTWRVTMPGLPGSRSCWLTVTNPQRPSFLACWTRSGACRS